MRRTNSPSVMKRRRVFGPAGLVEADRVADGLADALAQLARDARRGQARRQPPRLEHPDLAAPARRASSSARGTRVVLPAPGGASTTAAPRAATAAAIAGRQSSIGSGCGGTLGTMPRRDGHD